MLLKIKMTENPVYLFQPQQVDELEEELWEMRSKLYFNRIHGGDKDPMRILTFCSFDLDSSPWRVIAEKAGFYFNKMHGDDYKPLLTLALLLQLIGETNYLHLESTLKSSSSLPKDFRQMSKADQFLEVVDQIIEALDHEMVPYTDLVAIVCRGKTKKRCSQCNKEIIVQGILLDDLQVRMSNAEIVFNPVETERYICESSECYDKEDQRAGDKKVSWMTAVMAIHSKLRATKCDNCFLLAPLNEVHRSKCRTKNYCSQVCRDADDAVHKVCCNPDKEQRRIEERKVKIGGKDKVVAANATVDSYGKYKRSLCTDDPEDVKFREEVLGKIIKKTKPKEKSAKKKKKEAQIDEVD